MAKQIKTKDAKKGGYLVGKPHSEGGIKGINVDTNEPIEVEGGEVVITKPAVQSKEKYEFEGKLMTPKEILSTLNSDHGGVAFESGGEIVNKSPKMADGGVVSPKDSKNLIPLDSIVVVKSDGKSKLFNSFEKANEYIKKYDDELKEKNPAQTENIKVIFTWEDASLLKYGFEIGGTLNYRQKELQSRFLIASLAYKNKSNLFEDVRLKNDIWKLQYDDSKTMPEKNLVGISLITITNKDDGSNKFLFSFNDANEYLKKQFLKIKNASLEDKIKLVVDLKWEDGSIAQFNLLVNKDSIFQEGYITNILEYYFHKLKKGSLEFEKIALKSEIEELAIDDNVVAKPQEMIPIDYIEFFLADSTSIIKNSFDSAWKFLREYSQKLATSSPPKSEQITLKFVWYDDSTISTIWQVGEFYDWQKTNIEALLGDQINRYVSGKNEFKKIRLQSNIRNLSINDEQTPQAPIVTLPESNKVPIKYIENVWDEETFTTFKDFEDNLKLKYPKEELRGDGTYDKVKVKFVWQDGSEIEDRLDISKNHGDFNPYERTLEEYYSEKINLPRYSFMYSAKLNADVSDLAFEDIQPKQVAEPKQVDEGRVERIKTIIQALKEQEVQLQVMRSLIDDNKNPKLVQIDRELNRIFDLKMRYELEVLEPMELIDKLEKTYFAKRVDDSGLSGETAINGVKSQLTKSEFQKVRTPQFIDWFGDWVSAFYTNDYSGVSKIINPITEEPLVLFHGSDADFYAWKFDRFPVAYFGDNRSYSEWFAQARGTEGFMYEVFVNMKNPIDLREYGLQEVTMGEILNVLSDQYGLSSLDIVPSLRGLSEEKLTQIMNMKMKIWQFVRRGVPFLEFVKANTQYDGILMFEDNPDDLVGGEVNTTGSFVVFYPHQIKWANAIEFNSKVQDSRFEKGGKIENLKAKYNDLDFVF